MNLNQLSPAKRAAGVGRAPRPLPKFGATERRRSPYLIALAATLIRYEQRRGLKKPEFAETIGISESQYRSIRRKASNPSIIQLATIAGKLRIPLFTLLGVDVPGGKKLSGLKMTAHIALVVGRKCEESGLDRIVFAKKIGVSVPQILHHTRWTQQSDAAGRRRAGDAPRRNPVAVAGGEPDCGEAIGARQSRANFSDRAAAFFAIFSSSPTRFLSNFARTG
jgi:DNA-binding XRE family transcriptional regulator